MAMSLLPSPSSPVPPRSHLLRRLRDDQTGAVLAIVAGSILTLMILLGSAVDTGRAYMLRSKMANAVDAAALAAGALAYKDQKKTDDELKAEALRYYNANLPANFMASRVADPTITVTRSTSDIKIDVVGHAQIDTVFMKTIGFKNLNVSTNGQVTVGISGVEIAMVLDVTGSMSQIMGDGKSRIEGLRTAASELVNSIYGTNDTLEDVYTSVIPYNAAVNIGTQNKGWLTIAEPLTVDNPTKGTRGFYDKSRGDQYTPNLANGNTWWDIGYSDAIYSGSYFTNIVPGATIKGELPKPWTGCVEARTPTNDVLDTPPSEERFPSYYWWRHKLSSDTNDVGQCGSTTCTSCTPGEAGCVEKCSGGGEDCWTPCEQEEEYDCSSTGPTEIPIPKTCTRCVQYGAEICETSTPTCKYQKCTTTPADSTCTTTTTYTWTLRDPNYACPKTPILPLTNKRDDILGSIASLQANNPPKGGTIANQGLVWGWNTISPRWDGLWKNAANTTIADMPRSYDTVKKIAILMTDGRNLVNTDEDDSKKIPLIGGGTAENDRDGKDEDYTAYGLFMHDPYRLVASPSSDLITAVNQSTTEINSRMLKVCGNMKAKGIQIFTITFALDSVADKDTIKLYEDCATNPSYHYDSKDNAALKQAFKDIASKIKSMRLTK